MYSDGVIDENIIIELTKKHFGGTIERSTKEEDIDMHVDFWWVSSEGKRYGFDVKGKKKNKRSDDKKSDEVNWIELKNVLGNPGWLYGKSVYFVFIIGEKAVYVSKKDLINLVNKNIIKNKIVHENPLEFYTQYQRKGRKDIIIKVPNNDLISISKHIIELNNENEKNNV